MISSRLVVFKTSLLYRSKGFESIDWLMGSIELNVRYAGTLLACLANMRNSINTISLRKPFQRKNIQTGVTEVIVVKHTTKHRWSEPLSTQPVAYFDPQILTSIRTMVAESPYLGCILCGVHVGLTDITLCGITCSA